uniref:Uncharacterized protein n=1 Tax=Octopus bimaculoides TaxID=37653 RepID=A0A0L8I9T5_OCTBM
MKHERKRGGDGEEWYEGERKRDDGAERRRQRNKLETRENWEETKKEGENEDRERKRKTGETGGG